MNRLGLAATIAALALAAGAAAGQSSRSALMLEQAGQLEQAANEYRLAVVASPGDMTAYQGLVRLSVRLQRYDSLAAVSRRLMQAQPQQPDYALGLVTALLGLKRRSEALAQAAAVARQSPDRLPDLAEQLALGHENSQAIAYYLQARQLRKDDVAFADQLVSLYEGSGEWSTAAQEIVQAVNRQPRLFEGYRQKLSAYARRVGPGPLAGELAHLTDPVLRSRAQAEVYLALGREAEAVAAMKGVTDERVLESFARQSEAESRLNAALALYRDLRRHADAARVLRLLGRVAEAQAELGQDTGPQGRFELAELLREQGKYAAAADAYAEVLRQLPEHEPAIYGLAAAQLAAGNTRLAREAARKALRPSARLLGLVARTFFYEDRFDSAARGVDELLRQYPQSPSANDGLELALVINAGGKDSTGLEELARAMLDYETGNAAAGTARAQKLAQGTGPVAEQAWLLLARFQRRARDLKPALATLEDFGRRFPASPLRARALMDQASIYLEDLKDDGKYRDVLESLIVGFPSSPYVPVARSLLEQADRTQAPGQVR